jgi:hypothetical protein
MESVILRSKSKSDLKLIADLARKIGVKVDYIEDETEDKAMINAIETGRTGEYIDTDVFIQQLRK